MLRYVKDCHCNIKGVGNEENRYPRLEKPLEEHERIHFVHIVLLNDHADKLIAEDIGNDKPRYGNDHILTERLYHGKYACVPALRGLPDLCGNGADLFVYIPEHS